ncbi:uncharacterized protein TNCV_2080751 [Trichonephila clavipes]|nr:uncharacterized protein TNCV_2080751 [Trichonephila clavipes]
MNTGLREDRFSFRNIAERLGWSVSAVHGCWEQWLMDGTASRRSSSGRPRGPTEREDRHIWHTVEAHRTVSAAGIRAAVSTTVTQRSVRNRLLQGQLRDRHPVACILLSPSHCNLRHQRSQASAHWRRE